MVAPMERIISIGEPAIEVTLRRSARARRFSLRVSAIDGEVSLTMPRRAAEEDALAFARRQEAWLRKALARHVAPVTARPGMTILLRGRELPVVTGTGRSVGLRAGEIVLPARCGRNAALTGPCLAAFLKLEARNDIVPLAHEMAARLGREISRITLRDTRSRWGSCSEAGRLMFSWRLVMAPPQVLRYVVAHEVAHLVEMNHSPAFWRQVGRLDPAWRDWRHWLRSNGATLHRYRLAG